MINDWPEHAAGGAWKQGGEERKRGRKGDVGEKSTSVMPLPIVITTSPRAWFGGGPRSGGLTVMAETQTPGGIGVSVTVTWMLTQAGYRLFRMSRRDPDLRLSETLGDQSR